MYEEFYGLRERPFELGLNLRFLVLPEPHREALSNLDYGIASRKGVTVLTGEVGTGKTMMVRAAIARSDRESVCVHLTNPRFTRDELFMFIAQEFKLGSDAAVSKATCLAALEEHLLEQQNRGEHSTLIVDEAQTASDEILEELRLLTNMDRGEDRLLSLIFVGQPEFADKLDQPEFRHLKQRVALRCSLRALTLQETAAYIASRIRIAGGSAASVMTREAVQLIHRASGGIPRLVSVLCDNALVTGFAAQERPVGSRIVQEVCRDFRIGGNGSHEDTSAAHGPVDMASPASASATEVGGNNGGRRIDSIFGLRGRVRSFGIL
jgi:general secretion pathway protein A